MPPLKLQTSQSSATLSLQADKDRFSTSPSECISVDGDGESARTVGTSRTHTCILVDPAEPHRDTVETNIPIPLMPIKLPKTSPKTGFSPQEIRCEDFGASRALSTEGSPQTRKLDPDPESDGEIEIDIRRVDYDALQNERKEVSRACSDDYERRKARGVLFGALGAATGGAAYFGGLDTFVHELAGHLMLGVHSVYTVDNFDPHYSVDPLQSPSGDADIYKSGATGYNNFGQALGPYGASAWVSAAGAGATMLLQTGTALGGFAIRKQFHGWQVFLLTNATISWYLNTLYLAQAAMMDRDQLAEASKAYPDPFSDNGVMIHAGHDWAAFCQDMPAALTAHGYDAPRAGLIANWAFGIALAAPVVFGYAATMRALASADKGVPMVEAYAHFLGAAAADDGPERALVDRVLARLPDGKCGPNELNRAIMNELLKQRRRVTCSSALLDQHRAAALQEWVPSQSSDHWIRSWGSKLVVNMAGMMSYVQPFGRFFGLGSGHEDSFKDMGKALPVAQALDTCRRAAQGVMGGRDPNLPTSVSIVDAVDTAVSGVMLGLYAERDSDASIVDDFQLMAAQVLTQLSHWSLGALRNKLLRTNYPRYEAKPATMRPTQSNG